MSRRSDGFVEVACHGCGKTILAPFYLWKRGIRFFRCGKCADAVAKPPAARDRAVNRREEGEGQ